MKLMRIKFISKFPTLTKIGSLSLVATGKTHAEVIQLNLSNLGLNNQNITGINAGLDGATNTKNVLEVLGNGSGDWRINFSNNSKGIYGSNLNVWFFVNSTGAYANPHSFASNEIIGNNNGIAKSRNPPASLFKYFSDTSPTFGSNRYLGFWDGNVNKFGWLETTWDGTNFQFLAGAYENTAGQSILAGSLVSVPEPGTLTLGSLALLAGGGAAVRRYRKQRQSPSASTTNATDPVTPVA